MLKSLSKSLSAVAAVLLLSHPAGVHASGLRSLTEYDQSKAFAADPMYRWATAVKRIDTFESKPTITGVASGVLIAPDVYINAGHFTPRDNSLVAFQTEITFGANYNTSTDRYAVRKTQRYPGYVFGDTTTIDLGVGWTSSFVSGFAKPTVFGSVGLGQIGSMVDYGNIGDLTTGVLPSLGDRMGGNARRALNSVSSYPESRYDFFDFANSTSRDVSLNVKGVDFSSGAPWFNSQGQLAGLDIASTPGITIGNTVILDLTLPEVQAYLQPIIADSWARYNASVPEPGSLAVVALAVPALLRRRRGARTAHLRV